MAEYETEFIEGKMRITHPSGFVDIYGVDDLLDQRRIIEKDIETAKDELTHCDNLISQIIATIPKQPILTRLSNFVKRKG